MRMPCQPRFSLSTSPASCDEVSHPVTLVLRKMTLFLTLGASRRPFTCEPENAHGTRFDVELAQDCRLCPPAYTRRPKSPQQPGLGSGAPSGGSHSGRGCGIGEPASKTNPGSGGSS